VVTTIDSSCVGDSMNTASRMECTGTRNRVHISKQTANLLIAASKKHWIKRRDEKNVAKGLGKLEPFWLVLDKKERSEGTGSSVTCDGLSFRDVDASGCSLSSQKMTRMIEWNDGDLLSLLKLIATARSGSPSKPYAEHVSIKFKYG
jgi:hypothetical protein